MTPELKQYLNDWARKHAGPNTFLPHFRLTEYDRSLWTFGTMQSGR